VCSECCSGSNRRLTLRLAERQPAQEPASEREREEVKPSLPASRPVAALVRWLAAAESETAQPSLLPLTTPEQPPAARPGVTTQPLVSALMVLAQPLASKCSQRG
jgi:hypothetical protein